MAKRKTAGAANTIVVNKKARFDYFVEESIESGVALEGWEVKSLRDKRVQLREAYVVMKDGEAWLIGAHISPLPTACKHVFTDPTRSRKLLMHRREIDRLLGAVERQGYTVVPLRMYWKHGRAKLSVGLAKGKKQHDKRAVKRERDWQREKARVLKGL
jgi:SsrA-binding protein